MIITMKQVNTLQWLLVSNSIARTLGNMTNCVYFLFAWNYWCNKKVGACISLLTHKIYYSWPSQNILEGCPKKISLLGLGTSAKAIEMPCALVCPSFSTQCCTLLENHIFVDHHHHHHHHQHQRRQSHQAGNLEHQHNIVSLSPCLS